MCKYILTFCPKCNNIVCVDKYGLIECSRCHRCFIVDRKKKQRRITLPELIYMQGHRYNKGKFLEVG